MLVALTVIGAVSVVATVIAYGEFRWKSGTTELRGRLEAARLPTEAKVFDRRELEGLPAPVQRYFRAAFARRAADRGRSQRRAPRNVQQERGRAMEAFTSTQRVITGRPGFDWDARVAMTPGMPVREHDAYIAGSGTLHAGVFGLVSVVNVRDTPDLARGELMRFLAEAAWCPTSLLPSQGVRWDDWRGQITTLTYEFSK